MPELRAYGPQPEQTCVWPLVADRPMILGRAPGADLLVDWDPHVSRRHAEIEWAPGRLTIRKLNTSLNPLFHEGEPVESCVLQPGEVCVVGRTRLQLIEGSALENNSPSTPSVEAIHTLTFTREALQQVRYRDADRRLEVLTHLPELIWGARTAAELDVRLVNLLLSGVSQAEAAAVVSLPRDGLLRTMHADRRRETAGSFRPSSRLVTEALFAKQTSVLHLWEGEPTDGGYTLNQDFDWAFCTPVSTAEEDRWGLYLAGRFANVRSGSTSDSATQTQLLLQADVKFTELVAQIVYSVQKLNRLERQQSRLRQFLPPVVAAAMRDSAETTLLAPRECEVTILFGDLRGFSRRAEAERDNLLTLLDRVSQALGLMTQHVLNHGGVVGDYHGDAVMGFWGWPVSSTDAAERALRAALAIRAAFQEVAELPGHPLAGFSMAIGLAKGRSVAGMIGVKEHSKVTVYGPPVNLASRLEAMTRMLRVPILIDESLANVVRKQFSIEEARTRRLARVLPYGLDTPLIVSELLPGTAKNPELTDQNLADYDAAVDHFIAGRWDAAYELLHRLPPNDRAHDFLLLHIARYNRIAPADWNGIVKMESK